MGVKLSRITPIVRNHLPQKLKEYTDLERTTSFALNNPSFFLFFLQIKMFGEAAGER